MKAELGINVTIKTVESESEANELITQGWRLFNTHGESSPYGFSIHYVLVQQPKTTTWHVTTELSVGDNVKLPNIIEEFKTKYADLSKSLIEEWKKDNDS